MRRITEKNIYTDSRDGKTYTQDHVKEFIDYYKANKDDMSRANKKFYMDWFKAIGVDIKLLRKQRTKKIISKAKVVSKDSLATIYEYEGYRWKVYKDSKNWGGYGGFSLTIYKLSKLGNWEQQHVEKGYDKKGVIDDIERDIKKIDSKGKL
jgi:hypothetical protein